MDSKLTGSVEKTPLQVLFLIESEAAIIYDDDVSDNLLWLIERLASHIPLAIVRLNREIISVH